MELSIIASVLSGSIGIFAGWMLCRRLSFNAIRSQPKSPAVKCISGDMKLILVVRKDLKMGTGKIAAQCSHATISCYKETMNSNPSILKAWERQGQPKIVLKVDTYDDLLKLSDIADSHGVISYIIHDAGHTQVEPDTATVIGIGPDLTDKINKITGGLKLL